MSMSKAMRQMPSQVAQNRIDDKRTLIDLECPGSHDLNFPNRPVRTRMPGRVAGAQSMMTAPYADVLV